MEKVEVGKVERDGGGEYFAEKGKTFMVNTAIMNHEEGKENNKPWVVSLDLDCD